MRAGPLGRDAARLGVRRGRGARARRRSATAIASAWSGSTRAPLVELKPDTGHHHYLQIVDRLLDTRSVVDADLTDVTAGELVALVARYLAHQEAIDVRVKIAPPLDDPRWTSDPGRARRPALRRRRDRPAVQAADRRDGRRATSNDKRVKARAADRRGRRAARAAAPVLPAARDRAAVSRDVGARPARRRVRRAVERAVAPAAPGRRRVIIATSRASPRTSRARSARSRGCAGRRAR